MSWLTSWNRRKLITVNGSTTGTQSDYQMKLTVNQGSGTDSAGVVYLAGNIQTTFNDLRFTKSDGSTLLNYWIESITGTSPNQTATAWIKLAPSPDTIPTNPGTYNFYIYYNNIGASAASNGTNTFHFFDDFDGSSIDSNKWTQVGTVTVTGGYAALASAGASIKSKTSFLNTGFILEADHAFNTGEWWGWVNAADAPKGIFYRAGINNLIINHEGNFSSNITSGRLWRKITTSATQQKFYESNVELVGSPRAVPNETPLYIKFSNQNQQIYTIRARKYASPEPTFSTIGIEELGITATNMVISPSETPCRTGICTITANVTWQNLGSSNITFRPKIVIDGTTYISATSDLTIGTSPNTGSSLITTPTLSVGIHTVCPYPN